MIQICRIVIHSFEIILVLLCTVVALEATARRVALPSPFILLPAGKLLGYVPNFPHLTLDPDLVMYVFLPLLVYAGAALALFLIWIRGANSTARSGHAIGAF